MIVGVVVAAAVAFWSTVTPVTFTLYHLVKLLPVVIDGKQDSLAVISFIPSLIEV